MFLAYFRGNNQNIITVTFSTVFDMVAYERVMLEASASSLLTVGKRGLLAPCKIYVISLKYIFNMHICTGIYVVLVTHHLK